jgi:hypothetical protein
MTLKDPDGNNWTGSKFNNLCVLISPETVDNMDDIDAKPKASVTSSKTLVLSWDDLMGENLINFKDPYSLAKLYNGIVVDDSTGDIKGNKTRAQETD